MKYLLLLALGAVVALCQAQLAQARGMGGAHPEGEASEGYHGTGNASGYHPSGSESSEYHPPSNTEASGYHPSGAEASGYHPSSTETSGYHPTGSEAEAYHPNSAEATGYHPTGAEASAYHAGTTAGYPAAHDQLPTDAGYGMAGSGAGAAAYANHNTQPTSANLTGANAAAVRSSYDGAGTFNSSWYTAHPSAWCAAGWTGADAWGAASWAAVAPLVGGASSQPIQYNYGDNVTYQGNQVYSGSQPVASADQYYQQAASVAQSAPPANPQSTGWSPLGVFALVHQEQSTPHYVMQLAINKSGALAGNYCDLVTDTIKPVHGSVDKQTQRVAWIVGDNTNTVGEAGLYNLTQDEAPALIHIGSDKTQQWLLVRLKQPQN